MRSAPSKAKYIRKRKFRIFPLDYSLLVDTNNRLLSLAKDSRCLYIQYTALLDDFAYQVYLRHLLIIENGIIRGRMGWSTTFLQRISSVGF